jgi:hypothetical protein
MWRMLAAADELPAGVSGLVQYGAVGIIASLGLAAMWRAYRRECDRSDRLETKLAEQVTAIQDKVIPALLSATRAVEESTELMRDQQRIARWDRDAIRGRE